MQDHGIAVPVLPESVTRAARIGIPIAFLAAAALSFQGLFSLALAVHWNKWLAWLLPVALDVYAAVSTAVWLNIPAGHEAAKPAARNARLAISLTIGGNALYHLVATGAFHVGWQLILVVSTLPPFIAERLLHLVALLPKNVKPAPAPDMVDATAEVEEDVEVEQDVDPTEEREPKPKAMQAATGKRAAIMAFYNADAENKTRTSSAVVADATGATSSYVRRLYRELDANTY